MSFTKSVQVLLLVCLSLNLCCAHRMLLDNPNVEQPNNAPPHQTPMTGGSVGGGGTGSSTGTGGPNSRPILPWFLPLIGSGGSGSGSCSGSPNYGYSQPWYLPLIGGSGGGDGNYGFPSVPITCPVGCMPSFGYGNMGHWTYEQPNHPHPAHMSHDRPSSEPTQDIYGDEAQTTEATTDYEPKPKHDNDKDYKQPRSSHSEDHVVRPRPSHSKDHIVKPRPNKKKNDMVKQNVGARPMEKPKQDIEIVDVDQDQGSDIVKNRMGNNGPTAEYEEPEPKRDNDKDYKEPTSSHSEDHIVRPRPSHSADHIVRPRPNKKKNDMVKQNVGAWPMEKPKQDSEIMDVDQHQGSDIMKKRMDNNGPHP